MEFLEGKVPLKGVSTIDKICVQAVGTGVVQGTKVVGTGAVAVGSGVVQGTKAAGRATVTAGKAVVDTGAMIGSATVEGKPTYSDPLYGNLDFMVTIVC